MRKLRNWSVSICRWIWRTRGVVWGTILSNILLATLTTFLFFRWPWFTNSKIAEDGSPMSWVLQHSLIFLLCTIIFVLCTVITKLVSSLKTGLSEEELKHEYLKKEIHRRELLTLTGIPAGLIAQSVPLDEVFIPMQLRPNRPLTDYPLTDEQAKRVRQDLNAGIFPEEEQQILVDIERSWYRIKQHDLLSISDLWIILSKNTQVAVIQGFPGIGKSTLLTRLALHMARQCLKYPDPTMKNPLSPACIPIFIRLGAYASECERNATYSIDLPLIEYLNSMDDEYALPGLAQWLQDCLQSGRCLVFLDGLDEVSNLETRQSIQKAITTFVHHYSNISGTYFNRFLITSRIAGYDHEAFSAWPHYTLAELTIEQMKQFLPRWCRASVHRDWLFTSVRLSNQEDTIAKTAEQMSNRLIRAIEKHPGVRELTQNPLLLTLLAVMQQNTIELPRQRVELYAVITRTLLENRNLAKGLKTVDEASTIERLGPIAFEMQTTSNSFILEQKVMESLIKTISQQGGTPQEVKREAEYFLKRIRERGGIFALRAGKYFSFSHRTFQEYFAARYMLEQIAHDSHQRITEYVDLVHCREVLWREPFLLAVAYSSDGNKIVARQLIQTLLATVQGADKKKRVLSLLLVVECLVAAKPQSLGEALEQQIVTQLIQLYEQAQKDRLFTMCSQIENALWSWLCCLPEEAYYPPILVFLRNALSDTRSPCQRTVLTILVMIANRLTACSSVVFHDLIPPLLALAGLPSVGDYLSTAISHTSDPMIANMAVFLLSLLGKQGPGGVLLSQMCNYFRTRQEQLRLLARYSLEHQMLITPTVVPTEEGRYQRYIDALERWVILLSSSQKDAVTEKEIERSLVIHNDLLTSAEEVSYPGMIYLLNMLQCSEEQRDLPWKIVWQNYLTEQLCSASSHIVYQEIVLFWITLFSAEAELLKLVSVIEGHANSCGSPVQQIAYQFLALLSYYSLTLDDVQSQKNFKDLIMSENLDAITGVLRFLEKREPYAQHYKQSLFGLLKVTQKSRRRFSQMLLGTQSLIEGLSKQKELVLLDLRDVASKRVLLTVLTLRMQQDLLILRTLRTESAKNISDFAYLVLTHELAEETAQYLADKTISPSIGSVEALGLLLFLLEYVHQIRTEYKAQNEYIHLTLKTSKKTEDVERKLQEIVQFAQKDFSLCDDEESEIRLNIIRALPNRSANEIAVLVRLAKESTEKRIQEACASILGRHAIPSSVLRSRSEMGKIRHRMKKLLFNFKF